ncbi:hypothetical protein MKX01_031814 [Papaver californicum]|nr:hypothetical protein MKX01_031814 [Papaver californicum]
MIGFSSSAVTALSDAELNISEAENSSLIHIDVDQSYLHVPSPVKAAIFESFARQNMVEAKTDLTTGIQKFIKSKYGFPTDSFTEYLYADTSFSLFNKLLLCCIQEGGTLCSPADANGNYVSAANFMKVKTASIPTEAEVGFKLSEDVLTGLLSTSSSSRHCYLKRSLQ